VKLLQYTVDIDVARPISSVIPSLDGVVLGALAGTTDPLTLSSVHRLAGAGSLSGVRRVLLRLVGAGVVCAVPGGYVLNREHVAFGPIVSLSQLWREVFDRIRVEVSGWGTPPLLVGVYGPAARRDGDDTSDIDLLVISDGVEAADQAVELASWVERWTGNQTHVTVVSVADLRRMGRAGEAILGEWERDLVVIAGSRDGLKAAG